MRYVLGAAVVLSLAGAAVAADTPTAQQCKAGYKSSYSKTWTKDQFTKACADMNAAVKK